MGKAIVALFLFLFNIVLNIPYCSSKICFRNLTKPLKPTTTVSLASESTESKQSHPIEIHSVFPLQNDKVVITYGNLAFLSFEIIVSIFVSMSNFFFEGGGIKILKFI